MTTQLHTVTNVKQTVYCKHDDIPRNDWKLKDLQSFVSLIWDAVTSIYNIIHNLYIYPQLV